MGANLWENSPVHTWQHCDREQLMINNLTFPCSLCFVLSIDLMYNYVPIDNTTLEFSKNRTQILFDEINHLEGNWHLNFDS